MSQPIDNAPGPPPDPLVAAVLRATRDAAAGPCPDADVLALYADHALDRAELAHVAAHLPECARCQAIVAAYVRASEGELPVNWPEQVAAAAAGASGSWFTGWRWLVPMASLATVAVVAVWIGRGPANEVAEQARADAARPAQFERAAPLGLARPDSAVLANGGAPAAPSPSQPSELAVLEAERRATVEAAAGARAHGSAAAPGAAADRLAARGDARMKSTAEAAPMANAANAVQAAREDERPATRQANAPPAAPTRP
ncbi:MAG: zf-HC2 domain-containing protein, partial [Acidobacteriota bacterium]